MAGADDYTAEGMPEHYSKALSGRWTIKRERLRILPASWHKWTAFVEDIEALSETQAETVEAAPPVEEAPAIPGESADGWNCLAINRGWEIISEAGGRWFPTQKDLAKQIEREFSEAKPGVMNMHGLPLETSTIERELKRHGVSCKTARAKASLNIRGN